VVPGEGEEGMVSYYLMGTELQDGKVKRALEIDVVVAQ
jgi:hypothetical protein